MGDMDWFFLFERGTAMAWVALAILGVFRRLRRLERLGQIILPTPLEQEDVDYLASVKRSTYLRLFVKVILLLGGMIALFHLMEYVLLWRFGIIAALIFMGAETVSVDNIRRRLALSAQSREESPA